MPVWATDYYVNSSCDDNNVASATVDGTGYNPATEACTGGAASYYTTIADLNAKTFSAGDNISFAKGETWTSSVEWNTKGDGSDGSPITVTSHGSGAKPILNFTGTGDGDHGIENDDEWWVISNIELTNPHGKAGIMATGNFTNITISGCTLHNIAAMAIRFGGANGYAVGNLIDSNIIYDTGQDKRTSDGDAIYIVSGGTTVSNNIITMPAGNIDADCLQISGGFPSGDNVISNNHCDKTAEVGKQCFVSDLSPPASLLVEENYCKAHAGLDANGIYLHPGADNGTIIRYNYWENMEHGIYNNTTDGTVDIYGDIFKNSNKAINTFTGTTTNVYNNSFYDTDQGLTMSGGTVNFKNNIMQITGAGQRFITYNSGTLNSDYNLFYPVQNDAWLFSGTYPDNLAAWRSASGEDANSPAMANPLFSSAESGDFTLLPGSPAIDVGDNLGATYDDGLDPDTTWPDGIVLLDQDLFGTGWDIGAYVYDLFISSASPTGTGIGIDTDLNWINPDPGTITVDVYFEEVSGACDLQIGDQISTGTLITTKEQGAMTVDTAYCWRVDVIHAGGTETGVVYEFTTTGGPPAPPAGLATCSYHSLGLTGSYDDQGATVGE